MSEDERRTTAYHESGHAVVGRLLPRADPIHKVTIIPRGRALGVTFFLPEKDRYGLDRDQMLAQIAVSFGGRVAEELFLNQKTTGARQDFESATNIARDMVTRYGMSDELGPMVYGENDGEVFLGRSVTTHKSVSEATMQKVDAEIRRIIDEMYAKARNLIDQNREKVEVMMKALLEVGDGRRAGERHSPPRPPKPSAGTPNTSTPPGGEQGIVAPHQRGVAGPVGCGRPVPARLGRLVMGVVNVTPIPFPTAAGSSIRRSPSRMPATCGGGRGYSRYRWRATPRCPPVSP
jgi:cell division protease FtsH